MGNLVLVTGGAGFIGSNIVRALLNRGDQVRVFDNFSTGHRENVDSIVSEIDLIEADLRSIDACRRAVDGVSSIFHQAALPSVPRSIEDPHTSHEVNATGTLHMLVAARDAGVKRFVYASSSSVYGPEPKLPREEGDRPAPISPYAVSKLSGEQYCLTFWRSYGLETVALRYFNVFGPLQGSDSPYAAVVPRFIRALQRREQPEVYGDGEQSRDFTYVDNVVDANLRAIEAQDAPGHVYNVGSGRATSVNQLLRIISGVMNIEAHPVHQLPRTGDVRDSVADISRAIADLGYRVTTSVEQGIDSTVTWNLNRMA